MRENNIGSELYSANISCDTHDTAQVPGNFINRDQYSKKSRVVYQSELYVEVSWARWDGYAISVTRRGAAEAANVAPKPIKNLSRVPVRRWLCIYAQPVTSPSTNEHPNGLRSTLKNTPYDHNHSSEENRGASSQNIRRVWGEGKSNQSPDSLYKRRSEWRKSRMDRIHLDGVEQSQLSILFC
jgi:hypothetical protein